MDAFWTRVVKDSRYRTGLVFAGWLDWLAIGVHCFSDIESSQKGCSREPNHRQSDMGPWTTSKVKVRFLFHLPGALTTNLRPNPNIISIGS